MPLFGEVVRKLRRRRGITQEELADRTGLSVRSIRDIETGRVRVPRSATVQLLADAFGLGSGERERFQLSAGPPATAPPAATGTAAGPRRAAADRSVPAGLPPAPVDFTGRADLLHQLDGILPRPAGPTAGAVVIATISGPAGVGKTALAVHWAHQVADRFPDGQLHVELRGSGAPGAALSPAEALRGLLDAFGIAPEQVPVELQTQIGLYRSVLAGLRVLIILDDARDADQVRPLLPGSAGCLVVVTSRGQLSGLVVAEGARPVPVDPLSPAAGRRLLAQGIGADRLADEPAAADEIVARCAGLPLSLVVVAARAAAQRCLPLAALAAELPPAGARAAPDAAPDAVADLAAGAHAIVDWSYRALRPGAARLFRLLALHPAVSLTATAAASLAGEPPRRIRAPLAELTAARLLAEQPAGRYALHDVPRAHAAQLSARVDGTGRRRAALHRLLDHYLYPAIAAARLLDPQWTDLALPPPRPGAVVQQFSGAKAAARWVAAEHAALVAAVRLAGETGFGRHAWQLAAALAWHLEQQGWWQQWLDTQQLALRIAQRHGDRRGQARSELGLGRAYHRLGQPWPRRSVAGAAPADLPALP